MHYKVVQNDAVLSELYKAAVKGQTWKVNALTPVAKLYYNILEKKDLYYSIEEPQGPKRFVNNNLKGKSWSQLEKLVAQYGKDHTRSNPFL